MKYLETGPTTISAHKIHHVIQKKLAKSPTICDLQDFVTLTKRSGVLVKIMNPKDFLNTEDVVSRKKLTALDKEGIRPHLRDFRVMQARRGCEKIYVKTSHTGGVWPTYDLLKSTYGSRGSTSQDAKQGVNRSKSRSATLSTADAGTKRQF